MLQAVPAPCLTGMALHSAVCNRVVTMTGMDTLVRFRYTLYGDGRPEGTESMKLARFDAGAGPRLGFVAGNGLIDLRSAGLSFVSMEELIAQGAEALTAITGPVAGRSPDHQLADVRLLAPIVKPGKYLAIGMNYQNHLEESQRIRAGSPKQQLWFNKQTTCINNPFDVIEPNVTEKLDYEVELGVVIGKHAKGVRAADALDYVFGYFVANDVSARDWQFHSPTFTMGKSFDTHGPIGPWIVTADEVADPQTLDLRCYVNGELRQSSNTSLMIYPIARQIEYLSTAFTLEPGDLIANGTPEGVGVGMQPPVFLGRGDVVRCEVEGVGVIENRVAWLRVQLGRSTSLPRRSTKLPPTVRNRSLGSSWQRNTCGVFYLFHRKRGTDVRQSDAANQLLVHHVVGGDVGDLKLQEIVGIAAHPVEFNYLRQQAHGLGEVAQPLL